MYYPAVVKSDGDRWLLTFPDIPEAVSKWSTWDEAMAMAKDALVTALGFYFDEKREIPEPSSLKEFQVAIELPPSMAAKVLLLSEMLRQKVRPADLARRLGTTAQEVTRLTQLSHSTKIDGIDNALHALGKALDVRLVERAER